MWQKRALAKAGQLSQRCSADSTFSSQSRQRSDSVFLVRCSHRRRLGWCPLRNLTRSVSSALLRVFSLIWFVLVVYKSMKRWWLLGVVCLLQESPLSWFFGPSAARPVVVEWIPAWLLSPPAHCPKGYSVRGPRR